VGNVTLSIDGCKITVDEKKTVLEAALDNDIFIPHLCYHPNLTAVGVCRLCMVNVEGRGTTTSCLLPVEEGLVVKTRGPAIDKSRRILTELLIANYGMGSRMYSVDDERELEHIAEYVGIDHRRLEQLRRPKILTPIDDSNPFFDRDHNQCVLCGRCIRSCDEILNVNVIDFIYRGSNTRVGTFGNKPILDSCCVSCGECVVRCPTGSLMPKDFELPEREVKTTCPYCGVGCSFYLGVRGNRVVGVREDKNGPANKGSLCVKGRFGMTFVNHPDRLKKPMIKKNGVLVTVTWKEALELIVKKLPEYRGEKFAMLSSAKCTNEENYLVQKFTRAVMGTNNVDHCARLCHAPTVAGLAQSFGSGAMTNSIDEIGKAETILAIGTNTTAAHPVIALQVKDAVRRGAKLIVANPKEIDLCGFAECFLQQRPGTDVALLMGMMRVIVDEGLTDSEFIKERCENFDAFKKSLDAYTAKFVENTTGVPWKKIQQAARCYATNKPSSILFAMGITQHSHGTDNVLATSNLALLTGNVGREFSGVNPLRGQNNVQGACDMGALPNVYPGYQKVIDPEKREKFEEAWDCKLPDTPGLTHVEIFDAIASGKIKALYIIGENPILSEANANHVREAIEKLDFFVVQDIFLSETAELADVVLPAATFAEKDGTFTNTERRIQRVRKVIDPVSQSKPDWWIMCQIGTKLWRKGFDFKHPEEIMNEIASLTPSYQGVLYNRLKRGTLQWPCTSLDHPGTPFLHKDKFATKSGKGKFMPLEYKPSQELPDDDFPLILTTDRSLYHFHTSTMTRRVEGLEALNPVELLLINPLDAQRNNIVDGEKVQVSSRRGKVKVKVKVTQMCPAGVVSMTFHFREAPTNELTNAALDPVAKIPETKVCAVRIEKMEKK